MALSPLSNEAERIEIIESVTVPALTYEFNFETGQFTGGLIDSEDAIKQYILKSISTPRFRHLIYNDDYGCEIEDLIEQDLPFDYTRSEVQRMVKEAIIYDDRISNVGNFIVEKTTDKLWIQFTVNLNTGNEIELGVFI